MQRIVNGRRDIADFFVFVSLRFSLRPERYRCAASGGCDSVPRGSGGFFELTIPRAVAQITNGQSDDSYPGDLLQNSQFIAREKRSQLGKIFR